MEEFAVEWSNGHFQRDLHNLRVSQFAETMFTGTGTIAGTQKEGFVLTANGEWTGIAREPRRRERAFPLNYMMVSGGRFDNYKVITEVMFAHVAEEAWSMEVDHIIIKNESVWLERFDPKEEKVGTYKGLINSLPEIFFNEPLDLDFGGVKIKRGITFELGAARFVIGHFSESHSFFSASVAAPWEKHDLIELVAAANFLRTLSFCFGYNISWKALLSDAYTPLLTLHKGVSTPESMYPPVPAAFSTNLRNLVEEMYMRVSQKENHTLLKYPIRLHQSLRGHFETSAGILGPAIESLALEVCSGSDVQNSEDFKMQEREFGFAKELLSNFILKREKDFLTPALNRLNGMINGAQFLNINTALKTIERHFNITVTKQEKDAFKDLRNPSSHGAISEVSEKYMEDFFCCLNLYYKIALAYLGYDGDVIAYSHPGLLLASFSCHRHGILAHKQSISHELISDEAYRIWLQNGQKERTALDDWLKAECKLSKDHAKAMYGFKTKKLHKIQTT